MITYFFELCKRVRQKCWPKFKTGILERSKLESFGRSKLDTRPTAHVDTNQSTIQALFIAHPIAFLSIVRAMLRRLARQLARPVAPGIATVATPKSTRRDKPFPSARCVSSSETTEATGDPSAPLVRLSAPAVSAKPPFQNRYLPRIRGTTGFVGSGRASRT